MAKISSYYFSLAFYPQCADKMLGRGKNEDLKMRIRNRFKMKSLSGSPTNSRLSLLKSGLRWVSIFGFRVETAVPS
jgi:hypothetical protein